MPEVIGTANIADFKKWGHRLEQMGYTNYVEVLNAKDYGIPQNRRRCFMVSLLGGYAYDFPMKMKRRHVLKDMLERHVDRKYYLSDEHIERISNWKAQQKPLENIEKNMGCSPTLTARGAGEEHSGMVLVDTSLFRNGEVVDFDSSNTFRRECPKEDSPTLLTKPKFTDGDYDAMVGIGMTDSAIYHVAGDSIVVTVLMAIFGEMLGIDYRGKIGEYVESEVMGR